ncbi:MAG: hypothetical protein AAF658_02790 [Myxococcota bacterium]
MRSVTPALVICAFGLIACRDDNIQPDYTEFAEFFDEIEEGEAISSPGPDPFQDGEQRLAFTPFYDSEGFSDTVTPGVNGADYFIFVTEFGNQPTLVQTSTSDRVEGTTSEEFLFTGQGGFWGVGFLFMDNPQNFSGFQTLTLALLGGGDTASDEVFISMGDGTTDVEIRATDYGYVNDDEWHQIFVPISVFSDGGVDLFAVENALTLVNRETVQGDTLLVDNIYLDEASVEEIFEDLGVTQ